MRTRDGQAVVEFVVGIFALVLIISAIIAFGRAIPEATSHLSLVRVKAGRDAQSATSGNTSGGAPQSIISVMSDSGATMEPAPLREETLNYEVDISDIGNDGLLGLTKLRMSETAAIPVMTIPRPTRSGGGEP